MKNLILGIALIGLAVGCKNNENNQVSDASTVAAPEAGCEACPGADSDCATACDEAAKADCATSCDSAEAAVCPMTGKVEN